ncbi:MAG: hypothetical protein V3T65_06870 [Acidobacteriota bacterium]
MPPFDPGNFKLGPSTIRVIVGTVPAVGAEIVETVPAGVIWRVCSISFQHTTAAGGGNRQLIIEVDDGTDIFYSIGSNEQHGGGLTVRFSFSTAGPFPGDTLAGGGLMPILPLPAEFYLLAGHRIRTVVENLAAGDQFTAPVLLVEEFPS